MSRENVEVARRFTEAYAAEDLPTTFDLLAEDHVLVVAADHPHSGVYRGHAGVREYFRSWLGAWTDRTWDIESVTAEGGDVVVVGRERLRGKGSGVVTERRSAVVHSVRDGKIVRTRLYSNPREALEAAGLRE